MYALVALVACGDALVPGERVVGQDVAASWWYGEPGDRLGEGLDVGAGGIVATAPGGGYLVDDGARRLAAAAWAGRLDAGLVVADAVGNVSIDGVDVLHVDGATAWAGEGDRVIAATDGWVRTWTIGADGVADGWAIELGGVGRLAMSDVAVGALACDPACRVHVLDRSDGAGVREPLDAEAGSGFALPPGATDEVLVGHPDDDDDDGAGEVCDAEGACVAGLTGDHLGRAVSPRYAAGTFNKWIVPPRLRVVALAGDGDLAVEVGAQNQPVTLGDAGGAPVLGMPYYPRHGLPAGALVVVDG